MVRIVKPDIVLAGMGLLFYEIAAMQTKRFPTWTGHHARHSPWGLVIWAYMAWMVYHLSCAYRDQCE